MKSTMRKEVKKPLDKELSSVKVAYTSSQSSGRKEGEQYKEVIKSIKGVEK